MSETVPNKKTEWHHIDAKDQVLGRIATKIAFLLTGKHRTDYAANKVAPVYVVVTNSKEVTLTGRKEEQKMYYKYSGYPGGMKSRTAGEVRARDSRKLIELAVFGMLPKNSLRAERMKHLRVFTDATHPHLPQFNQK